MTDNSRGILFMCASMLAFTLNDTMMKVVTQSLPLFEAIFLRGIVATLGLMILAIVTTGRLHIWPGRQDLVPVVLRTVGEIGSTALFLAALVHMQLANLSAIMQSLPLAVTLGAALFLGEPIGWRRLAAIFVGFCGVMIIIRPGTAAFDGWSLMGAGSVLFVVLRDLSTRRFSATMPSVVPAIWAAVAVTLAGAIGAVFQGYVMPSTVQLGQTTGAAVLLIGAYMMAIKTMRVGDIGMVAPFRYTSLLWAILFGWLLFGTLPDRWTVIGAVIVVASGIYMLLRERQVRLSADRAALRVAGTSGSR
jgi:drug/metabolite transporter (DMT)-like permease